MKHRNLVHVSDVTGRRAPTERRSGDTPDEGGNGAAMTIDELARRTGMTVRNIRAYQSRGLVAPPKVRGRTGFYGADHLARIELIRELQADGFNLGAIKRLLEGAGDSTRQVLDFTRAVREPFAEEEPEIVTTEEQAERWGDQAGSEVLQRAEKLGLIRPLGDGRLEIISPRLNRAGAELARLGVPPERALEVAAKMRRQAQAVARTFVELFIEAVWKPFDEGGRSEEEWPRVVEALERLRPLASEALLATFQLVMTEVTEEAFGRELKRGTREPAEKPKRRGRRRKK
jgi:DNA-binding transcriptional MerR regulator